jgi:chemotaxis protein MotB
MATAGNAAPAATEPAAAPAPVVRPIIRKIIVEEGHAGAHGGAWKIAFADFATAMMAFFLVMWLMTSATPEQKKAISGYFQDPIGFTESASPYVIDLGGTPTPAPERTLNPDISETPESQPDESGVSTDQIETLAEKMEQERLELLLQELQTMNIAPGIMSV